MPSSMKDVAREAGVSLGTVSNVLNRPDRVSPETRRRVERAIHDLHFVPSAAARSMRVQRSRVLGLIVPDISNPFFTDVARGVEDAALEAGFPVILCNSDERPEREDRYLEVLESQRVGAILITPARRKFQALGRLINQGVALALLDNSTASRDACSVSVDDIRGGQLAAEHILSLGHQRIAWLAGPRDIPQVADREAGLFQALAQSEVDVVSLMCGQMTTSSAEATVDAALASGLNVTGLVCANDLLALGAIRSLGKAGLQVPDDVSVIGYDDISFAASAGTPLTSIRQPSYELGQAAASLVIAQFDNPEGHAHQQIQFQPQLVVRESTAQAPASV